MSAEFLDSVSAAVIVTGLAFVCLSVGYAIKSQSRMMQIQAEMLHILGDLGRAQAALLTDIKSVGDHNDDEEAPWREDAQALLNGAWRTMPKEEQRKLKAGLITLLAQMDRPDLHVD